jgi:hypothetical protein
VQVPDPARVRDLVRAPAKASARALVLDRLHHRHRTRWLPPEQKAPTTDKRWQRVICRTDWASS